MCRGTPPIYLVLIGALVDRYAATFQIGHAIDARVGAHNYLAALTRPGESDQCRVGAIRLGPDRRNIAAIAEKVWVLMTEVRQKTV
jgi:hypothetical protein